MSIRSLLMPAISQRLLSRKRLLRQRARAERRRRASGARHEVLYFHQVDDPYSALVADILPAFAARYDVDISAHVVGVPPTGAAPQRDKLVAYSRRDAQLLARHVGLDFTDIQGQPSDATTGQASALLVAATQQGRFIEVAGHISKWLWGNAEAGCGPDLPGAALVAADEGTVTAHRISADALRAKLGHYLGATFHYGGEWYWGIDRLHHLERRLQDLGTQRGPVDDLMFPPDPDLASALQLDDPKPIDFFFSLRSPYSAIVAPRVFEIGRLSGAQVRLRFVLPMVMRGLPVPKNKRMYISQDAAREAFVRGIPFGRVNDPVGRPTERGLALIPLAERLGQGQRYLLSFMRGVWSEGINAGSDRGLRRIAERAGIAWSQAQQALQDESWRSTAESNRAQLFALGLWGVPSFRVGDFSVWGQDRLWALQQALQRPAQDARRAVA